ncbi:MULTISPECIES: TIGR02281 family clan AA aspartic protease [Roseobacteraceae]|uniref:retropepsin-like aspartic protease family protein n=1 Tax=Roseobacteraceae TaxID=2854170 RepID=UPI00125EEC2E|nr:MULTISPECIES: TIGR02281 family clan AA aspartic protease [Roseobacteraceae]KAB6715020.1 TIGR02281 family clan AA aspartic protease [Roseobacter sp. TSBP12]|tara:strand:- start:287 stop:865 length:579 start_codon:yes stop_codon:yes gene_type:complete
MDSFDTARILYLSLLLGAVGFYYIVANRRNLGQLLRHAALWALIFIGALAAVGLWQDVRPRLAPAQIIRGDGVIQVDRDQSGHFSLTAIVNGAPVEFLVDTGASNVVLSLKDAERAGINVDDLTFTGRAQTANGTVRTAPVKIDTLSLGGIQDDRVRAYVTDGDLFGSLLGMDYLRRYDRIEIKQDKLILTR